MHDCMLGQSNRHGFAQYFLLLAAADAQCRPHQRSGEIPMANVKNGQLVHAPQWWKHLREWKRVFWKRERRASKRETWNEVAEKPGKNSRVFDFMSSAGLASRALPAHDPLAGRYVCGAAGGEVRRCFGQTYFAISSYRPIIHYKKTVSARICSSYFENQGVLKLDLPLPKA
jgi:hypothetical protein